MHSGILQLSFRSWAERGIRSAYERLNLGAKMVYLRCVRRYQAVAEVYQRCVRRYLLQSRVSRRQNRHFQTSLLGSYGFERLT
jgi:hypothetical protein